MRMAERNFTCLCQPGFSGQRCEIPDTTIKISFKDLDIPSAIRAHFITVQHDSDPTRLTTFSKIGFVQNVALLYNSKPFHLVFIELKRDYYLSVLQEEYQPSTSLSKEITPSHRCVPIQRLLNATVLAYVALRRVKHYHKPCKVHNELMCFYDETFMCLCNADRHANCFDFNHNMTYDCSGNNYCENGAECYQDDASCPTTSMCICAECFYGTNCQFTTKGFGLSLDAILGYQIQPRRSFVRQPVTVRVTAAVIVVILIVGVLNGSLCTVIFRSKTSLKIGCSLYLLASSIVSLLTASMLAVKFCLLLLTKTNPTINPVIHKVYCISTDFLLRVLLNSGDWFNACVAIERAFTVWKATSFDRRKSRRAAKWVIFFVIMFNGATAIHDPLHRHLVDDIGEQRTWCIVRYPSSIQLFHILMNIIHFVAPFSINIVSSLAIIANVTQRRTASKHQQTYRQHLYEQLREHKHLLISPWVVVILALPRLVIALISGCMKSARNPTIFIAGYLISFVPPLLLFFVFVFPSRLYMRTFRAIIKH